MSLSMPKLTDEEKKVLLTLSELEPSSLDQIAAKTGLDSRKLQQILQELARKGLLEESEEDRTSPA